MEDDEEEDDAMEEDDGAQDEEFAQAQSRSLEQAQEARYAQAAQAAGMVREHSSNDFDLTGITVPEEYLDPLTAQLMRDPVKLPTSKKTVDRVTMQKHFLLQVSETLDPTRPFSLDPRSWTLNPAGPYETLDPGS